MVVERTTSFDPSSKGGTVLISLGGSILAASVLALISLSREDLLEGLFRQGVVEVFPSRLGRCPDEYWVSLLASASREYRVLGVANHGYIGPVAKEERYERLFREAIDRGVVSAKYDLGRGCSSPATCQRLA